MKNFLMIVPIAFVMLFSTQINAADVQFHLIHDGLRVDGQPISFAEMDARLDCGIANDGNFADWSVLIEDLTTEATAGDIVRTITPPEQRDYWCVATMIETATGLESNPSNVKYIDLPDRPTDPTLDVTVIVTP